MKEDSKIAVVSDTVIAMLKHKRSISADRKQPKYDAVRQKGLKKERFLL